MARSFLAVTAGSGTKLGTNNYTDGADSKHDELVALGEQFLPTYMTVSGPTLTTTANSHLMQIMAGASLKVRIRRIEIYQAVLATAAALMELRIYRLTTAGTGGVNAGTNALDPAEAGSGATSMILPTVKGAEGAVLHAGVAYMMQTLGASNQLAQPIYVVNYDFPHTKPLIIAAGATNGIAIKNVTAVAAGQVSINVWLDETPY